MGERRFLRMNPGAPTFSLCAQVVSEGVWIWCRLSSLAKRGHFERYPDSPPPPPTVCDLHPRRRAAVYNFSMCHFKTKSRADADAHTAPPTHPSFRVFSRLWRRRGTRKRVRAYMREFFSVALYICIYTLPSNKTHTSDELCESFAHLNLDQRAPNSPARKAMHFFNGGNSTRVCQFNFTPRATLILYIYTYILSFSIAFPFHFHAFNPLFIFNYYYYIKYIYMSFCFC